MMNPEEIVCRIPWPARDLDGRGLPFTREWLVTNGMGGYASGTLAGVLTRRYHGLLVAALPSPIGRALMMSDLAVSVSLPNGREALFGGEERLNVTPRLHDADILAEFRLETGLPVWRYEFEGLVIERRVFMPHFQNTVYITYQLLIGDGPLTLRMRPGTSFRRHDDPVNHPVADLYPIEAKGDLYEIDPGKGLPPLRMMLRGRDAVFTVDPKRIQNVYYNSEAERGYESTGELWTPGSFQVSLTKGQPATLIASTESAEVMRVLESEQALAAELYRRQRLLEQASAAKGSSVAGELVLAADQFLITPAGRVEESARAHAYGEDVRTVIAGYHWFTDWGRDTMISLEGLTLMTGREAEARWILRTFLHHVRYGLLPNMFPEGQDEGLYHTADATLWFFHAVERYVAYTNDRSTLHLLLPALLDIVHQHIRGTRFGIHVDPKDGLLTQGTEGLPLTWMDAQVAGWVVTPRRGKPVEINALWYNALRLLESWVREKHGEEDARLIGECADRAKRSFNERFWYKRGEYLYDLVDGDYGDDSSLRPNQIFALSLSHPVLNQERWEAVVDIVRRKLLTPVGLRSLAQGEKEYKSTYYGDRRARDAAYHQGTVWGYLIGPFVDAWLKVHPNDHGGARSFLEGFLPHLREFAIGTVSEVFDAEAPYTARGCVAQAWSVAELLRCWVNTAEEGQGRQPAPEIES